MTKREAFAEACRRWFTGGTGPEDVVAFASRGRTSPIYRVSARRRGTNSTIGELVAAGLSDESWEAAFVDADRRQSPS